MRTLRQQAGFTLIEVVLALSIVASIVVIVWGSIGVSFESRNFMMNAFDQHQQIRLSVDRMSREFSMAYITSHANKKDHIPSDDPQEAIAEAVEGLVQGRPLDDLTGQEELPTGDVIIETAFVGRNDEVHFTSMSHIRTQRDEKTSDQAEIAYFVRTARRRDSGGRLRRELVRREDATLDDDVEKGGVVYTMIDDVEEVKFEYWEDGDEGDEEGGGQWVDRWDSRNSDQRGKLPSRVRITIEVPLEGTDGKRTRTFVTQAPIMMTRMLDF